MSVRITGTAKVASRLERAADRCEDLTPVWTKTGTYIRNMERKQFATEGAALGTPWKPLSPATVLDKKRQGYASRKTLVRTGLMRSTFTSNPMNIQTITPLTATFGSDDQKAIWQHFGTFKDGKRHIPPRTIIKVTPELRANVLRLVRQHVLGSGR